MSTIDALDHQILTIVQQDARATNADISRRVGLAPSAVLQRIRRLQSRGVITGFAAHIQPESVNLALTAFVSVRTSERPRETVVADRLCKIPQVLEVHDVAGDDCYLLKIVARDIDDLHQTLRERIAPVQGVEHTTTTIVLKTFKNSTTLPLAQPSQAAASDQPHSLANETSLAEESPLAE